MADRADGGAADAADAADAVDATMPVRAAKRRPTTSRPRTKPWTRPKATYSATPKETLRQATMRWPVSRRARRSAKIAKTTVNLPANRTATGGGDAAAAAAADAIGTSAIATATTGMMSKAAMNSSRTANSRRPISNPSLGA